MNNIDDAAEKTWRKVSNAAKDIGYAEGASQGRESVFQQCFDDGYELGFDVGMTAGFNAGMLRASITQGKLKNSDNLKEISKDPNLRLILDNAHKGQCMACIDDKLLRNTIETIKNVQMEKNVTVKNKLSKELEQPLIDLGLLVQKKL